MNISTRTEANVVVIDIEGKLDTQTCEAGLEYLLDALSSSPAQVLIDLASLEFVSSAGLRVILRAAKHVRAYSGELKVSGAQGVVKEVLEISGFDSLLDLYEGESQAIASF
jgi:anti-sigma B factor antagonist